MENESTTFYCDKCLYGTNFKYSYEQHLKTTLHITGKRKERVDKITLKCEFCTFESHNKNNYMTHRLNNHLGIEERQKEFGYYCNVCDFGSFDKKVMDRHNHTKRHSLRSTTHK
jgi:hypothetical protein